ncbi:alginate lyase family protein [Gilvimarinus agarilyticus]|uniref:alginate lyase family protein n=1 Tax=Gilvimarinus sp. 2_MG-2023 TaxID=3062666 RepID=UPI001C085E80|nr:alginate lyase family protein [Gilvimarinus sp. 2_MG-2023]MBU2886720.1 alginate lyase family protein [Gilvimarinus agarilyticus]MDO6571386.1 alginate lyase family protein [Gilvimarinus sp. 2_MG-2023]
MNTAFSKYFRPRSGFWLLIISLLAACKSHHSETADATETTSLTDQWQQETLSVIQSPVRRMAVDKIVANADQLINSMETFSVTFNQATPPSGNPRDYTSTGPYWWPNPNTEDGLPWVKKDGMVNREVRGRQTDSRELSLFTQALGTLAQAYAYTGDQVYSDRAALLLEVFLFDSATGMNPNFRYAQAIPGITDGRGIGIIESRKFISVINAHQLLQGSSQYRTQVGDQLHRWIEQYLQWLITSPNGIDESLTHNNHASFYDYQVAFFANFIGDKIHLHIVLDELYKRRIETQINPGGEQPHELERTRPYHYSAFNLEALWGLAAIAADNNKIDAVLPHQEQGSVPLLVAALDYLNREQNKLLTKSNYASVQVSRESLIQINLIAGQIYHPRFTIYAKKLMQNHNEYDCLLVYPVDLQAAPDTYSGSTHTSESDGLCQL